MAEKETNVVATMTANTNVAIPTNAPDIQKFITVRSAQVEMAKKVLEAPNAKLEVWYRELLKAAQEMSVKLLKAEVKLVKTVNADVAAGKYKSLREAWASLKISKAKWYKMADLTDEAIDEAAAEAEGAEEYVSRYRVLQLIELNQRKEAMDSEAPIILNDAPCPVPQMPADGKFEVVYADLKYATTTNITDVLPVADNSVLFLWVNGNDLPSAFNVLEKWGFTYRDNLVWNRNAKNGSAWAKNCHSTLLIATKGEAASWKISAPMFSSVYRENAVKNGYKPDYYYDCVQGMYPDKICLEVFSERDYSPQWVNLSKINIDSKGE